MAPKKYFLFSLLVLFFTSRSQSANAAIVINEYSCSNLSQVQDDYAEYGDWIELYNTGAATVDISGFHLSDNPNNPSLYTIPNGVNITPGGFKRFWASGRNTYSGVNYHTNFSLKQSKNNPDYVVLA